MSEPRIECSLALKEIQEREVEQLHLADIVIRKVYAKKVRTALENLRFKRKSEEFAEKLVTGEESLDEVLQKEGKWQGIIKNACTDYQGLCDISFLLLNAPRKPFIKEQLAIEHDSQARDCQLKHFYTILTHNLNREKCPKEIRIVRTHQCLIALIKDFIQCFASRSKRAFIVFNGHGKESGHLSLEDETKDISNTSFIDDVYKAWDELKQEHDDGGGVKVVLPQKITVVLAHCFGYKYNQDEQHKNVVDVVCLTNENNPETKYAYKFNTIGSKVKESLHFELTQYARQESLELQSQTCPMSTTACPAKYSQPCSDSYNVVSNLDGTFLACVEAFSSVKPENLNRKKSETNPTTLLEGITKLHLSITSTNKVSDFFGKGKERSLDGMMAAGLNLGCTPLLLTSETPETNHTHVTAKDVSQKHKLKKPKKKDKQYATGASLRSVAEVSMAFGGYFTGNKDSQCSAVLSDLSGSSPILEQPQSNTKDNHKHHGAQIGDSIEKENCSTHL